MSSDDGHVERHHRAACSRRRGPANDGIAEGVASPSNRLVTRKCPRLEPLPLLRSPENRTGLVDGQLVDGRVPVLARHVEERPFKHVEDEIGAGAISLSKAELMVDSLRSSDLPIFLFNPPPCGAQPAPAIHPSATRIARAAATNRAASPTSSDAIAAVNTYSAV